MSRASVVVFNALFDVLLICISTYKGSKIEWSNDECAGPLVKPRQFGQENIAPKKKNNAPMINRFQLLTMDGTEGGSDEEDHNTSRNSRSPVSKTLLVSA